MFVSGEGAGLWKYILLVMSLFARAGNPKPSELDLVLGALFNACHRAGRLS